MCWNAANCSQTRCIAKHTRPPPPKVTHAHNTRRSGNRAALPQHYQKDKKIKRADKQYYCTQMNRSSYDEKENNQQKPNNQTNEQENHTEQHANNEEDEEEEFYDSFTEPQEMSTQTHKEKRRDFITGINNTGNTCYQNAVLQCIKHSENITQMVGLNAEEDGGTVTQEIDDICKTLKSGEVATITPCTLQSIIKQRSKIFSDGRQQDAHEYLQYIINELVEEEKENNKERGEKEQTGNIKRILYGKIRTTWECKGCSNQVEKEDIYNCLHAKIPRREKTTPID